jgi:ribonuclease BN (tRNA processing enzyme)
MQDIKLVFYGVRGSYPVPDKRVVKYGGNTASILVETHQQQVILDAGTGIINLGKYLLKTNRQPKKINLFLTHLHFDHIQGLPFFDPVFDSDYEINIYSDETPATPLKETIYALFNQPLSPIGNDGIKATINFSVLNTQQPEPIRVGDQMTIAYIKENFHPLSGVLLYRVNVGDKHIVYATDIETPNGLAPEHMDFIKGADILIHDSMYFDADYYSPTFPKKGFGHSTVSMAVENASKGDVKKLFLFHYDPNYSDEDVEQMHQEAKKKFPHTYLAEELKEIFLRR